LPQADDGFVGVVEASSREEARSRLADAMVKSRSNQHSAEKLLPGTTVKLPWMGCECGGVPPGRR
jgi:hypothetical protein